MQNFGKWGDDVLTDEQIKMLESLENGTSWEWFQSPKADEILHFLVDSGYCTAREDIALGWICPTEQGKAALARYRIESAEAAQRKSDDQAREAKRLQERHEDQTNEERRYRTQNKISIRMPLVTFVLGLLVEHFYGIVSFCFSVFHE